MQHGGMGLPPMPPMQHIPRPPPPPMGIGGGQMFPPPPPPPMSRFSNIIFRSLSIKF